jgi:hypothetical protein
MYQFAQLITFSVLGDEYLIRLATHFRHCIPASGSTSPNFGRCSRKSAASPRSARGLCSTLPSYTRSPSCLALCFVRGDLLAAGLALAGVRSCCARQKKAAAFIAAA